MAEKHVKVAMLEDDFAALSELGLPFSMSFPLQSAGHKLSKALWTAKSSSTGFSISLIWPLQQTHMASASQSQVKSKSKKKKKRRSRKKHKATAYMSNQQKMM